MEFSVHSRKADLRLGDSQHYLFMGATKHLFEQLLGPTRDRQNHSVWSSAFLWVVLCSESFQYLLQPNAQVFSLPVQIQPTGFCCFCLSLAFSVALLKYFWCFWLCDLLPRCCTLSGTTMLVLLPHPLCMFCLSVEASISPRARGRNLSYFHVGALPKHKRELRLLNLRILPGKQAILFLKC